MAANSLAVVVLTVGTTRSIYLTATAVALLGWELVGGEVGGYPRRPFYLVTTLVTGSADPSLPYDGPRT